MKTCGILLNERDYLIPYVSWLLENQELIGYTISGIHTNNEKWFNEMASQSLENSYKLSSFEDIVDSSDVVVSLSYWNKIDKETIEKVPMGIINFHHSYKLKYRGRHSATWAIRRKEKVHGSTMHFIDENLDSGKIIDTDCFDIEKSDVAEDVFLKANDIGLDLLKRNFAKIINQECIEYTHPSDDYFSSKESDLHHEIEISSLYDTKKLIREIKALTYGNCPAPYVRIDGHKLYLKLDNYDSGICNEKQQ